MSKPRRVPIEHCRYCGRKLIPRPDGSAHHLKCCTASACMRALADDMQVELDALPKLTTTGEVTDETND